MPPPRFLTGSSSSPSSITPPPPPPPPSPLVVHSDFVVILAALLCALICAVGLIAVARCAWLRRYTRAALEARPPPNKGLKKKVIQALPKRTFQGGEGDGKLVDCAICLTEFSDGDEVRVLPRCEHGFHVGCIDTWLGSHSSCPSCRQVLVVTRCKRCGGVPEETGPASTGTGAPVSGFLP